MTNPNKSEIIIVLDRSGSMESVKTDTIGGFNAFLKRHKEEAKGEVLITLAQFDDRYDIMYSGSPVWNAPLLTSETYVPRGMTALYDAVGRTINEIGSRLSKTPEYDRPSKIIFVILTDGHENSSKEFTQSRVQELIKHQTEKYSWQFVFLGADQDAFQGKSVGVHANNVFTYKSCDTRSTYDNMIDATCAAVNCLSVDQFSRGLNLGGAMSASAQGCTSSDELAKILTGQGSVGISQNLSGTTGSGTTTTAQILSDVASLAEQLTKMTQLTKEQGTLT